MTLLLIRHGETNTSGQTYAGRSDVPLTERGHRQAEALATSLSHLPIKRILCSPLSRALDTARPLAQVLGIVPEPLPELSEIDFGRLEGRSKAELGLSLRKSHAFDPVPEGESLFDVWNRVALVQSILRERPLQTCAVVGHFWSNRLLWGRLQGLPFDEACRARGYRPQTGSCEIVDLR